MFQIKILWYNKNMDIIDRIEEGKIKGYLTTNKRIIFEGAIYHVTQRAPGKEIVFVEESDYLYFLKLAKETVKKFSLDLFCFSLLPNHLHLCLRTKEANLSKAMKSLFERYANYFNKKYKRKGHVFCGRYRASLCNDESYLLAISIYIHLNPYKAGLCSSLEEYRWSSFGLYSTKHFSTKTFINYREVLALLSSKMDEAREKYVEMIKDGMKFKESVVLEPYSIKKFVEKLARGVRKAFGKEGTPEDMDKLIENFKTKKKTVSAEDKKARKYLIEQLLANGYLAEEIIQLLSIGRTTFYRVLDKSGTK